MTPAARKHLVKAWEAARAPRQGEVKGLPQRTWEAMDLRTRAVLVMLGAQTLDDPRKVAQRPWASLSDMDRIGIAACAKSLSADLKHASCLF